MSKLPERNPQPGYIRPKENVGYIVAYDDGQERTLISAHGFHLESSDFNDLYLPALQFIDDAGKTHFISVTTDGTLLVDDSTVVNLNDYYTKQDVYSKKEIDDKALLRAPDGTKYQLTVDNAGKLGTQKI